MKRRDFLKCSLAVGAGLAASPSTYAFNGESKETGNDSSKLSKAPATKGGKPHIIFIMSDQHRGDALHCMGNKAVISPNIDKLAQEGSLFVCLHPVVRLHVPVCSRGCLHGTMGCWDMGR